MGVKDRTQLYFALLVLFTVFVISAGQSLWRASHQSDDVSVEKRKREELIWCTINREEQQKCLNFANANERDVIKVGYDRVHIKCKQAFNKDECMQWLDEEKATLTTLDAGEMFIGGRYHSLVPIAQEVLEGGFKHYYAVAVVKKDTLPDVQSLHDLRGKKACFAGVETFAGWVLPINTLMKEGGMNIVDCNNHVKTATNYFGPSCAVNCLSDKYNPIGDNSDKLCKLCIGKIPGGRCTDTDPYAGYEGAFKCLLEVGEIAFLKHNTVPELVAQLEFAGLTLDGFELLCKDGTRRPVNDYLSCHWGQVPSNAIVTSSAVSFEDRTRYQKFLQKFSERYGKRAANGSVILPVSPQQSGNRPDLFGNSGQQIEYDEFGNPRQPIRYDQFGNVQQKPDFSQTQYDQYGNRINRFKRQNFGDFGGRVDSNNNRNNPYGQENNNRYGQEGNNPYRSDSDNPYRQENNANRQDGGNPYTQDNNNPNPYKPDDGNPFRPDTSDPYNSNPYGRDNNKNDNDNPYRQENENRNPYRSDNKPNNENNPYGQENNNENPYRSDSNPTDNDNPYRQDTNNRDNKQDPFARDPYIFNPDKFGQNIDPYNTDIPKYNPDHDRLFPTTHDYPSSHENRTFNGTYYEVFSLFDSSPKYGIRANLMFQDAARAIAPVAETTQTYTNFLGDSLKVIMGVRDCPVGRMTLCVTSDAENNKCVKMRTALKAQLLKPEIECYKAHSQIDCMKAIQGGIADVAVLDASDVYTAGLQYHLVPFISEVYNLEEAEYYVVAVAKESDPSTELTYLRGKYTCHGGINTAAGWVYPLAFLISNGWIRPYGCNSIRAAAEYFAKSCVPGALSTEYNTGVPYDNMCDLCHGPSFRYCRRDASEDYYGNTGAFRCLVEGGGHVAFVKHTTVTENTGGKKREWWARDNLNDDFELLCPDGTRAEINEYTRCNLGKVRANAIVTREIHTRDEINAFINLFMYAQTFYGRRTSDEFSFSLFTSEPPYSDLIFQDATTKLKVIEPNMRYFSTYLGSDFMRARRIVDCHAGSGRLSVSFVTVLLLGVVLYF